MSKSPRQLALEALHLIHRQGAYADVALNRVLQHQSGANDSQQSHNHKSADRRLTTELVYGATRRQRTLDALIDRFARKPAEKQTLDLRLILHLGIYQLCYLDHIPPSAAVNTSVDLAKQNQLSGLAGLVNAILRAVAKAKEQDTLWTNMQDLGVLHSFPDWLVQLWQKEFGPAQTEALCQWFNRSPHIDLRINPLRTNTTAVLASFAAAEINAQELSYLPHALRLAQGAGEITRLPGFAEGWWSVQDASAQMVAHLLDPQPDEVIIDACAAPGGKTTHIAELMQDQGTIWACDRYLSRLKKVKQNSDRLGLKSIQIREGDSRTYQDFTNQADRVLLDVPCSGLGTLHRHADARWRQTAQEPENLALLQTELLNQAATWVKSGGTMVYATCTLHPAENEAVVTKFLAAHANWQLVPPPPHSFLTKFLTPQGWVKVLPHEHDMDGFFMAKLQIKQ